MSLYRSCILCRWFAKRIEPSEAALEKVFEEWDYDQANDQDISDADPLFEQVLAGITLKKSDPERAFKDLLFLAEQGSVWAMLHVGWCYCYGEGVTTDVAQGETWYRRATDCGSQHALLGYLGFPAERKDWVTYDAVLKHPRFSDWAPALRRRANRALSRTPSGDTLAQARQWYERAAGQGDRKAALNFAAEMARGRFGVFQIPAGWRRLGAAVDAVSGIKTTTSEERVEAATA